MILVYIPCSNKKEAKKVALHLLRKKLIACANIFPIESMYLWKGKIEKSKEFVALVKSVEKNWARIQKEVRKVHSYSVPCMIRISAKGNKEYEKWLKGEVK